MVAASHGAPLNIATHASVLTSLADADIVFAVSVVAVDTLLARTIKLFAMVSCCGRVGDRLALSSDGWDIFCLCLSMKLCLNIDNRLELFSRLLNDFLAEVGKHVLNTGFCLGFHFGRSIALITNIGGTVWLSKTGLANTETILAVALVRTVVWALHKKGCWAFLLFSHGVLASGADKASEATTFPIVTETVPKTVIGAWAFIFRFMVHHVTDVEGSHCAQAQH